MPFLKNFLTLMCVIAISIGYTFAQPVANFTANPEEGCVGEVVQFANTSDLSACTGVITYEWDFGNGETSTLENPATTFQTAGLFDVSLRVTSNEGFDTHIFTVEILPTPDASFEDVSFTGCAPYAVDFNNTSTQGGGVIDHYYWTFGDGISSDEENPSHTFSLPGEYTISLTATNENGCFDVFELVDAIQVSDTPSVSFIAIPREYCQTPLEVNFDATINVSPSYLGYTTSWDFGDGGTGSLDEMSHTYSSMGNFDVQLIVTDDYGCQRQVDSLSYIEIQPLVPAYTILDSDIEEVTNGIVCLNEMIYFSNDNDGYNVIWTIDGDVYNQGMVNVSFTTPGMHDVSMTVDPGGDCEDVVSFQIEVEDPTPSYTINPSPAFSCEPPYSVDFTSTAAGNVIEYHWMFGDGSDSDQINPTHVYNSNGTFQPVLEVITDNGCVGTFSGDQVEIAQPSAAFVLDTLEGCVGLLVSAEYGAMGDVDDIVDFTWDFGDGSPVVSGTDSVSSHVYNTDGEFDYQLTVTDLNGCTSSQSIEVTIGTHQTPLFDFSSYPTEVCPLDSLNFNSLSTNSSLIDDYEWLFGDTDEWQWGTSTEEDPQNYTFDQDTGWVQVAHVVNYNGCRDTLFVPDLFHVGGPIVNGINVTHDCAAGNNYSMYVDLVDATEWDWWITTSDNSTIASYIDVTDSTLVYNFPGDGDYMVHVLATNLNTGCEYEDSVPVSVIQPTAVISPVATNFCAGMSIDFNGSSSINAAQYHWDFGDGSISDWSSEAFTDHMYNTVGDVTVTLTVQDVNGCEDTETVNVHIVGPEVVLNGAPVIECTPYNLNLTGEALAEDPIILIEIQVGLWDTTLNVSDLSQNVVPFDITHLMEEEGVFDVIITARTNTCPLGNTVVFEDFVNLTSISADFNTSSPICLGEELTFSSVTQNPSYTYDWDLGDGTVSSEIQPSHTYANHGVYSVELTIEDPVSGCVSTVNVPDYVEVQEAILDFSVSPVYAACPPLVPVITNNSSGLYGARYDWESGDGDQAYDNPEPEFQYSLPGEYNLHLIVTTSHGCTAEAMETITVEGPSGQLIVSETQICLNEEFSMEIQNAEGVDNIEWTLGDGTLGNGPEVTHSYEDMPAVGNQFHVVATLSGGSCDVQYEEDILLYDVQAKFNIIDAAGEITDTFACSPMEIDLVNISSGEDLSYTWTIEGMSEQTSADVLNLAFVNDTQIDSVVDVNLAIQNSTIGCFDETTVQLVIGHNPEPNITPDTVICENSSIVLHAEGGADNGYVWYPGFYLSDVNVAEPLAEPEEDMTYYVTVTGENSCVASDSVSIVIQHPNTTTVSQLTDTIFLGESTSVFVTNDQESPIITWLPDLASISCLDCEDPVFNPLEDTEYQVCVSDSMECFSDCFVISISVLEKFTLDVPAAFTPEGNPINSIVYVRGIGIEKLIEFSIYNRWGEKLFTTDDINQGWNGYYNDKLQPVDTYVYYVEAQFYDGRTESKKGHILLMQ